MLDNRHCVYFLCSVNIVKKLTEFVKLLTKIVKKLTMSMSVIRHSVGFLGDAKKGVLLAEYVVKFTFKGFYQPTAWGACLLSISFFVSTLPYRVSLHNT